MDSEAFVYLPQPHFWLIFVRRKNFVQCFVCYAILINCPCLFLAVVILVLLVTTKRKIKAWPSKGKDSDDLMGKNAYCGLGTIFSWPKSGADTSTLKYSVTGILFLRFVFSSSTIIPRANLPLTLESKFGTGVVSVGYLNSMQAVISTITGLTVGPVVSRLYQNDSERMVKHAGFVKAVSAYIIG